MSGFIKIWREQWEVYVKTHVNLWYVPELFLEWEVFQTKVVKKIKTHIFTFSNVFPAENRASMR